MSLGAGYVMYRAHPPAAKPGHFFLRNDGKRDRLGNKAPAGSERSPRLERDKHIKGWQQGEGSPPCRVQCLNCLSHPITWLLLLDMHW